MKKKEKLTQNPDVLKVGLQEHYKYINQLLRDRADIQYAASTSYWLEPGGNWASWANNYKEQLDEKDRQLEHAFRRKVELEEEYKRVCNELL